MKRPPFSHLVPGLVVVATLACGGKPAGEAPAPSAAAAISQSAPAGSRDPDLISEAEVAAQTGVTNAFDLVRRVRPNFLRQNERSSLRTNSSAPLVRLDGQLLGEVETLRDIAVTTVAEVRFYSIVEAESRFSGTRGRPVIAVTSKKK